MGLSNTVKTIAYKIGMDKAVAYSSGSRIVGGIAGALSVFFISTFLTGVEQGFYFTFGSILALQTFFELGLTNILTQFVSHEASHLKLNEKNIYSGEDFYISRLASLLGFCIKWYTVLSVLIFIILSVAGVIYFNQYGGSHPEVNWKIPWILICIGTALKLFQAPFTSIFMGLGKVKEMSKITFWQQVVIPCFTWIGFILGWSLYVVGLSYILTVLMWIIYVWRSGLINILFGLLSCPITVRISYLNEIFPYQWRIALSSASGYFIFQLFNPVLFATEGAVVAGQMGMTLHALSTIQSLSQSWLNTKVPLYAKLIALKEYSKLDLIFTKTLKQMIAVCLILLAAFFVFVWILNVSQLQFSGSILSERFLSYLPMFLMMIPVLLQQFINSWATYLRCHKKEPYLIPSICCAVLVCFSVFFFGGRYGLYGITFSYCLIMILLLPWWFVIYKTKKKEWHEDG